MYDIKLQISKNKKRLSDWITNLATSAPYRMSVRMRGDATLLYTTDLTAHTLTGSWRRVCSGGRRSALSCQCSAQQQLFVSSWGRWSRPRHNVDWHHPGGGLWEGWRAVVQCAGPRTRWELLNAPLIHSDCCSIADTLIKLSLFLKLLACFCFFVLIYVTYSLMIYKGHSKFNGI